MPDGKVNSGDNRKGNVITPGHQFGTPIGEPEPFGNTEPQSNATLDSNPVTWAPSPAHFGNTVGYSLQTVPPIVIVQAGSDSLTTVILTTLTGELPSMSLTYSGAPTGVTVSFAPNPDTGVTAVSILVAARVPAGKYTITVAGTAATEVDNTNIHLVVINSSIPIGADFLLQEDGFSLFELEDGSGFILLEN